MTPTIFRTKNLAVRVYPKDHQPPHVHVVGPNAEAKFEIETLRCLFSRGFSRSALLRIELFLKDRKEILMETWDEYQK